MNGLIYTRVSSKEQIERTSLATQENECQALARKQQVVVIEECIFREEGESAKVADRTELQRLLRYVRDNKDKVDILYIWKIDRLSRNLGDYYGIKVALSRYNVKIVSVTEPIEDDPVGRFLEAILAAAAQFDNEIRAMRTIGGMRARVEQGEWPHDVAIGYIKQDRRVVPDKKFAPIIKDILIKFSEGGYTYTQIAQYAFSKGVMTKSGKPKSTDAMKSILRNYIYAGYTVNKLASEPKKGKHKALVELEIIQKNREIIDGTVHNYSLQGDDLFPLRGTLLCVNCGQKLTASQPKGQSGEHFPAYHCNRGTCTKKKTGKRASRGADVVHEDFRKLLRALAPLDKNVAQLYKKIVVRVWNDQFGKTIESIRDVESRISKEETFKASIGKKFIEDKITEEERDLQVNAVTSRLVGLESDLKELKKYKEENQSIIDNAMEFIENPESFWNHASTPVKKLVQRFIAPEGIPYDFETGYGTIRNIESYLLIQKIAPKGDLNMHLVAATGIEPVTLGL